MSIFFFTLREGFNGLRREKLLSIASIITITLALGAIGVFGLITLKLQQILRTVENRMRIEVIVSNSLSEGEVFELQTLILGFQEIDSVKYITKELAAQRFQEEFGENITELLSGENPLPRSLEISLKSEHIRSGSVDNVIQQIRELSGVTDIIYPFTLFVALKKYRNWFLILDIVVGVCIAFGSMFLVSNTIKLTIFSKKKIIEIMRYVGATQWCIRQPFFIEGLIQGFLGGVFACAVFAAIGWVLTNIFRIPFVLDYSFYGIIVTGGLFLGGIGSVLSIKRFLT